MLWMSQFETLSSTPVRTASPKLKGELASLWRIRVRGSYRMVYEIDDDRRLVTIINVGTRGGIYG